MFVYASNLGVLFSTFAGFALLFCIKVVAEGEVVAEEVVAGDDVAKSQRKRSAVYNFPDIGQVETGLFDNLSCSFFKSPAIETHLESVP